MEDSEDHSRDGCARHVPDFVGSDSVYSFSITGGCVWIDHESCNEETSAIVIENSHGVLRKDDNGKPILALDPDEAASKDSELIACEIECLRAGLLGHPPVLFVDLAIDGLD